MQVEDLVGGYDSYTTSEDLADDMGMDVNPTSTIPCSVITVTYTIADGC
ncbi:hypothetical protein HNR23_004742 [Nocardiopsis mwathae]|uniref:Uncharacterized protein n=1 Tax=Nocardiopsis mwathae TaxID=1472723 RepID=A0A7W9YMB3_9ACTN|nr:hypothetical protein [Nocardiopsis mwathae]MBB6174682.1 hypothetical protein [Nocardiopsis mwathae]